MINPLSIYLFYEHESLLFLVIFNFLFFIIWIFLDYYKVFHAGIV